MNADTELAAWEGGALDVDDMAGTAPFVGTLTADLLRHLEENFDDLPWRKAGIRQEVDVAPGKVHRLGSFFGGTRFPSAYAKSGFETLTLSDTAFAGDKTRWAIHLKPPEGQGGG